MNEYKSEKEYMFERVKTLYGDKLNEDQLEAIKASLDPMITVITQLRSIPLENSDEPYSFFKPYRKDEK